MERLGEAEKWEVAQRCAHFNLKRTVRAVTQHFEAALTGSGLHVTQFTLLVTSSLLGPALLTELAERLMLDRTSLTRALAPLVRDGLMEVAPGETDRRQRLVSVTPRGEAAVARAYPAWQRAQGEVMERFERAEYDSLLDALERLRP